MLIKEGMAQQNIEAIGGNKTRNRGFLRSASPLIFSGHAGRDNTIRMKDQAALQLARLLGKVCIRAKWPIRSELIPVSVA